MSQPRVRTKMYMRWSAMRKRCFNPNDSDYKNYGARGITICDRWLDFKMFLKDMGEPPQPGLEIDRIDNNGPYSPENCQWASRAVQLRNTRRTRLLTINGETLCLTDWAARVKAERGSLRRSARRRSLPLEAIITERLARGQA